MYFRSLYTYKNCIESKYIDTFYMRAVVVSLMPYAFPKLKTK